VAAALAYEDLRDVTLVVHSYAGMLAPDVTVQAAGRVARVVYLDAYLPHAGRSCHDYLPPEGDSPPDAPPLPYDPGAVQQRR
jgi:pimeloyl-ACP methyl ester carboxylesterase